ncbi:hypothetical protein E3U43_008455 [Larimichthys crocea]|uniref:Uncharacterized protein n=1 Tax=Larimichthys crocea TaxID=215358 RepID=A0ACD3RWN3_LARCR|nr:hypothetical protein E3U43_008455 [Larimichthys crocea]
MYSVYMSPQTQTHTHAVKPVVLTYPTTATSSLQIHTLYTNSSFFTHICPTAPRNTQPTMKVCQVSVNVNVPLLSFGCSRHVWKNKIVNHQRNIVQDFAGLCRFALPRRK